VLPILVAVTIVFLVVAALHDRRARRHRPERATRAYWEAARAERREARWSRRFTK